MGEKKFYSMLELKKHHRVYNELIDFLKKTITIDECQPIVDKFEENIGVVDREINAVEGTLGMYLGGVLGMITSSMVFDNDVLMSGAGLLGGLAGMRYILCLMALKEGKFKKLDYVKYLKSQSEYQNNIVYPFEVGRDVDFPSAEKYAEKIAGMSEEELNAFINNLCGGSDELSK